jgi:hypothetical protein
MDDHPLRGELRLVVAAGGGPAARLGLVLRTEATEGVIEIALVHPYTELATGADAVVAGALAGTPYDLVVQSDLRGVVWGWQATRRVGQVDVATLDAASELLVRGRPGSPGGIWTGTPLVGPHDRRWAFKVSEGLALDALTGACTAALLERL